MPERKYRPLDRLIMALDHVRFVSCGGRAGPRRGNPAAGLDEPVLTEAEKCHAAGLMRVNHAGEVAAQALYAGQALVARDDATRESLRRAGAEENDHLLWCMERVEELGSHVSYLGPLWYLGSFAMGTLAGAAGDRWNLGFVLETERQVVEHLERHQQRLPPADAKSRRIVERIRADELQHADAASTAGARALPWPVRALMRRCARVMTGAAYWI